MYELKPAGGGVFQLLKNKKPVKKTALKEFARYGLTLIRQGKSLADIPTESNEIPSLADIITTIDKNFAKEKSEAEDIRLAVTKEKIHQAVEEFRINPCKENESKVKYLNDSYGKFLQHAESDSTIVLENYRLLDEDFYDVVQPDNPLTEEDLAKFTGFGDKV